VCDIYHANGERKNTVPSSFREGVETMGDECSPVGQILPLVEARDCQIGRRDSPRYIKYIMTLNVNRQIPGWGADDKEALNKSQIFVNFLGKRVTFYC